MTVRVRSDADDQTVLSQITSRLSPLVRPLTVQIFKDDWKQRHNKSPMSTPLHSLASSNRLQQPSHRPQPNGDFHFRSAVNLRPEVTSSLRATAASAVNLRSASSPLSGSNPGTLSPGMSPVSEVRSSYNGSSSSSHAVGSSPVVSGGSDVHLTSTPKSVQEQQQPIQPPAPLPSAFSQPGRTRYAGVTNVNSLAVQRNFGVGGFRQVNPGRTSTGVESAKFK